MAEGAGAASIAGAIRMRHELRGKKVALVKSSGNSTLDMQREIVLKGNEETSFT